MSGIIWGEVFKLAVQGNWENLKEYFTKDFTYRVVHHDLTFNQEELIMVMQTNREILSPEDELNLVKVIEIGNFTLSMQQILHQKNGNLIAQCEQWILTEWFEGKMRSSICYDSWVVESETAVKWLDSLSLEDKSISN